MAELEQTEWRLRSGKYLGEISALCFIDLPPHISSHPYLLAGSGSQICFYSLEAGQGMDTSFHVFKGIRVHGLCCRLLGSEPGSFRGNGSSSTKLVYSVVVFGERRIKLYNLAIELFVEPQLELVSVYFTVSQSLPKFSHWVLDVTFIKDSATCSDEEDSYDCLAIGCGDNSVHLWDISKSAVVLEVRSPDRCLLYSMRLWGHDLESLRVASGTIYNEIIVWKVVSQNGPLDPTSPSEGHFDLSSAVSNSVHYQCQQYVAVHMCKLVGHEGSIFRLAWSSDGCKLVSVSDDRSAHIWAVQDEKSNSHNPEENVDPGFLGPVLFGHNARIWDCFISDSLIVTAGEDCTCRVWGVDGKQLKLIKEHVGRGIWRCLYDPRSSLLVTAGFDSAIKVHELHASLSRGLEGHVEVKEFMDKAEMLTARIPNSSEHFGLMDSKSEYVRCLQFSCENNLYVATNHGYIYQAKLSNAGEVRWTELIRVSKDVPVICIDLLSGDPSNPSCCVEDWVAVGDGKGNMTVIRVDSDDLTAKVGLSFTWSAEVERQLLGTYWCKSLGQRHVFTADPRGNLKLWRLCNPLQSMCHDLDQSNIVSLIAKFTSPFGIRIMCLDASFDEEVMVCGDLRGNLILFPLSKNLLLSTYVPLEEKISPIRYFKGAHGISAVSNISVARLRSKQIGIRSTGGDGCICCLEYDREREYLEFIGMKQVKELSLVRSVSSDNSSVDNLTSARYAVGFASSDFIIWNLRTEAKVVQIPCGGWRRPHSYYLGDIPEMRNCFAYVKDEIIYIHRHWVPDSEKKMFPRSLHMQFHGREMHTLCFVSADSQEITNPKASFLYTPSWIVTGCEDGTVRLTRHDTVVKEWMESKLLGEHVGGSAVRSICSVSKMHIINPRVNKIPCGSDIQSITPDDREHPFLLISVGAKRVLTSWQLRNKRLDENDCEASSMSFQWLSTDTPTKSQSTHKKSENGERLVGKDASASNVRTNGKPRPHIPGKEEIELKSCNGDNKYEDDWRYMSVTAFLVKCAGSRLNVCFVVVACSDASLALRALILPYRLWFDVALLVPLSSPVLALQHVVIPMHTPSKDAVDARNAYLVISGATDGSMAFWDLTGSVEAFMERVSTLHAENFIDCQKRPRTGRGSQGGRWWRASSGLEMSSKSNRSESSTSACSQPLCTASEESKVNTDDTPFEISEISPLHVLKNVHQSGVNCLHVSDARDCPNTNSAFQYNVISGGDDQALHCVRFELSLLSKNSESDLSESEREVSNSHCNEFERRIRFLNRVRVASAHSSAVKGVWADKAWVFSTGLDQRVRCWHLEEDGKLREHSHLIVTVPEPEALDAKASGTSCYQIAVAGRGLQMIEFDVRKKQK